MGYASLARSAAAVGVAFGLALSLPSASAAESERSAAALEEVVVTARRREETAQSVPIPITALTGDELRDRGAFTLKDIDRLTPNLDFSPSGSSRNSAQVFLRGIGQTNWSPPQDPKVGIYLDGVYLGRPQGSIFGLLDVERIEVLRGPQGTLFGRNTTAGLVHVVTRRPGQAFEATAVGGVGNDGHVALDGMVNVPLADTLAARISVQARQTDGHVRNVATGRDWSDEDSRSVRAALLWSPRDDFEALLSFDAQRRRERSGLGECTWGGPATVGDALAAGGLPFIAAVFGVFEEIRDTCNATEPFRSTDDDPDRNKVDGRGVALTLDWDLGFAQLTSISAWRDLDELNQSWGWASDTVGSASYLEVLAFDDTEQEQRSQELRLTGTAMDGRLTWVAGGYWFEEEAFMPLVVPLFRDVPIPSPAQSPLFYAPAPPALGVSTLGEFALLVRFLGSTETGFDSTNESWAAFMEGTLDLTEKLSITAGVRYTEDDREYIRTQTLLGGVPDPTLTCPDGTVPPPSGLCRRTRTFDETTPRVILSYSVSDDVMVYGGWSKGYSSGGFNQDVRMRAYEPEVSKNWELGIKSTWLDRRLRANVTTFYNTYENQQLTIGRLVEGQPTADLINAQEASLWGIEGEFTLLLDNWLFSANFGWMDGEYEEFLVEDNLIDENFESIIVVRDVSDTEVVRRAPYTVGLSAAYTVRLAGGGELVPQIGYFHRGRTYNTLEAFDISRQKAYGLLDGRVTWRLADRRTTVSLWGTNLLDKEYYPNAIDLSGAGLGTGTVTKYWAPPRRYGLELRYDLGG
jgi:iron complex outermembrane recepter protein